MDRDADLIERDFAGQIERYRSRTLRTWSFLVVISVCAVVAGSRHLPQLVRYAIGAGVALGGVWLALLQFRTGLRCPSCRQALDLSIADFVRRAVRASHAFQTATAGTAPPATLTGPSTGSTAACGRFGSARSAE